MLSVVTIVVHQILHNQRIEYANEFAHVFAHIIACAHVQQRVSDYFAGENRVWEAILISS